MSLPVQYIIIGGALGFVFYLRRLLYKKLTSNSRLLVADWRADVIVFVDIFWIFNPFAWDKILQWSTTIAWLPPGVDLGFLLVITLVGFLLPILFVRKEWRRAMVLRK